MKVIKTIVLIPLVIILFLVLTLFQANLSIRSTLFSESYFSDYIEEVNLGEKITQFGFQKIDNINIKDFSEKNDSLTDEQIARGKELVQNHRDLIIKSVDQEWLAEQINLFLSGTQGYLVNDLDSLPTLDIEPAKELILDYYTSQIMAHSDRDATIREIKFLVNEISQQLAYIHDNYDKEAIVQEIMKIKELQELGLGDSFTEKLVHKLIEVKDGQLSVEEIYTYMVEEMISESLNLDTMKNELNLHEIGTKVYPQNANPIYEIKSIVDWYKADFLLLNILIIILLITMISMLTLNTRSTAILISRVLLVSGLVVILLGSTARKMMGSLIVVPEDSELFYFKDIFEGFISGIINNFITGGVIYLVLGALTLGLIYYVLKKDSPDDQPARLMGGYPKILIFLVCIAVMTGSLMYTAKDLNHRIESFTTIMQDDSLKNNNRNILSIVAESLNAKFL